MHPRGPADRWPPETGQLPAWHPDAPSHRRTGVLGWLRRRAPVSHRHYDALTERVSRVDARREDDFRELWSFLGDLAERGGVRIDPDSLALTGIRDQLDRMEQALHETRDEVTELRDEVAQTLGAVRDFLAVLGGASETVSESADRLRKML